MVKMISSTQLKELMDSGEEFLLIDCREQEEWDDVRIKEATLMPFSTFMDDYKKLQDKNVKVVMFCRSGPRSARAAQILDDEGFKDVHNLHGGIIDWMDEGYDIEG